MAKPNKKVKEADVISEGELRALETLQDELYFAKRRVKDMEAKVKAQEVELMKRIDAGATFKGTYVAMIEESQGACRPEWKEQYLSHQQTAHNISREQAELEVRKLYPAPTVRSLVIVPGLKVEDNL